MDTAKLEAPVPSPNASTKGIKLILFFFIFSPFASRFGDTPPLS